MRAKSWLGGVAALALLLPACKGQEKEQEQTTVRGTESQEQTEQVHRQSGKAFEEAKQAQQEAKSKQEEVAKAEEKVQKKQQELEQAKQEAAEKRREAQQAAQEAQEKSQEAQQVAQQASQQAQQTGQAGEQTASGRVAEASQDAIVLERQGQPPLRLQVDEQTTVMVDGEQATPADIQQGSQVRASYRVEGDQPVAVRIEESGAQEQQPVRGQD